MTYFSGFAMNPDHKDNANTFYDIKRIISLKDFNLFLNTCFG